MEAGIVRGGRTLLALLTAAALVASMLFLLAGTAEAGHIDPTGTLESNCVEFQAQNPQETGTKSPSAFPNVDITVVSWDDSDDPHSFQFTISGLESNQYVEISVKSGTDVVEDGPYGNGSHSYESQDVQAISHIRLCVFESEEETTTSTEAETTTSTIEDTTTTTVAETTTTVAETTTTVEILETTLTSAPTTSSTVEDEVLGKEVLPFTGLESGELAIVASALALLGSLVLLSARRTED
jgi:hypothetical protein